MPLLDVQRRGQQIGRIRIGQQVATGEKKKDGSAKMRPVKLDTFRFTTGSRPTADAIAEHFGGTVREWGSQWEVITGLAELPVTVPPRDQIISQWYEMWTAGGCQRRCDSQTETISGKPCLCPHADDPTDPAEVAKAALARADLAKRLVPQACKPVTRISVMIPDLPGLGVFRLDTGSYYAATEIGDAAALMQLARDRGVFLPAILRIDQRSRVANGQTKKYPVPVLEVLATFRQIASGELEAGGITAQLPPAPGEAPKAITGGPAAKVPAPRQPAPARPAASDEDQGPLPDDDEDAKLQRAQQIASEIARDIDVRAFNALVAEVKRDGLQDQYVCTDRETDEWMELGERMTARWGELTSASRRGPS